MQLDQLDTNDNVYRIKSEIDTSFFRPFPTNLIEMKSQSGSNESVPFIKIQSLEEIGRTTINSQNIFTIDSPTTVEIDDGISIETLSNGEEWIHIHIADPTRLFLPETLIDLEAR
jgi:exoribonuclease R